MRRVGNASGSTRRNKAGLTLIETLLALLMLSLMIVGLLGLLGSLLVSSTKVSDSSSGIYLAQSLLERAASSGRPPTPDGGEETGTQSLHNHETKLPLEYHYRLSWTPVGDSRHYTPVTGETRDSQYGVRLYHVKVTVWWMVANPEDGRGEGGGKRSTSLERVVQVRRS